VDSGRNMWECFCIQELVQFIGDKLVAVYELHGSYKVQVKFTLEQDTKVQKGNRVIALLFLLPWR